MREYICFLSKVHQFRYELVAGVPPGDGEAGGGGGLPPRPGCRGHQPRQEEAPAQHRGHGAGTGGHRSAVVGQSILSSDWSVVTILSSNWSVVTILSSDWSVWSQYSPLIGQCGHNTHP